ARPGGTEQEPPITESQVAELGERVQVLLDAERFVEALDLLDAARGRAEDPELIYDLSLRLAMARFFAGSFSAAAQLFAEVGALAAVRYGEDDQDVAVTRYYLAQCRDELGDISGALEAFRDVAEAAFDPSDKGAVDRHLDALWSLMRLYAVTRRRDRLFEAAERMEKGIRRYRPNDAEPMLAELRAYLARLMRLLDSDGEADPTGS
ncbi:tol-pal system YbgF family protein, partial [Actinomadura adrarensis]